MTLPEVRPSRRRFLQGTIAASVALAIPHSLLALEPIALESSAPKVGSCERLAQLLATPEGRARLAVRLADQLRAQQGRHSLVQRVAPGVEGLGIYGPTDVDFLRHTVRVSAPYSTSDVAEFLREVKSLRNKLFQTENARFITRVCEQTPETSKANTLWDIAEAHETSEFVVVHPRDFAVHRQWMRKQPDSCPIDFETHRELLTAGIMAYYRGIVIRQSVHVPIGEAYSFGEVGAASVTQEKSPLSVHIELIEGSGSPDKLGISLNQATSTAIGKDIRRFHLV